MPMNISASVMPSGVKAILSPDGSSIEPIQPFCEYSAVRETPATAVGSANGRSIIASMIFRPGKV
ncbi:hypothetical protein D3C86_1783110 [compost metagenome]